MTENMGLDLFGGHALEEIPEDNNLPKGTYPETVIDSAKVIKSKNTGQHGIAVNFKDISEDGFGLTAFKWIGIPAAPDRAQYLLRDLKSLTLTGEQLLEIARNVKGTDPSTAEVNIDEIDAVLNEIVGVGGTTKVTEYKNKRTGEKGLNVSFEANEDEEVVMGSHGDPETESNSATSADEWFSN